mmetsp:Transcript_81810/g.258002  ORF Transcript_81810/g.258002 Transcript_81810/m.258002 type:complete len:476 (-) Transcript_81810:165-1592(-)
MPKSGLIHPQCDHVKRAECLHTHGKEVAHAAASPSSKLGNRSACSRLVALRVERVLLFERRAELRIVGCVQHEIQVPLNVEGVLNVDELTKLSERHSFLVVHLQPRAVRRTQTLPGAHGHDPLSPLELSAEEAHKAGEVDRRLLGRLPGRARPVLHRHVVRLAPLLEDPGLRLRVTLEARESSLDLHVADHHQRERVRRKVPEARSVHAVCLGPPPAGLGDLRGASVDVCIRFEQRSVEDRQQIVYGQVALHAPRAAAQPTVGPHLQDRYPGVQSALWGMEAALPQPTLQLPERAGREAAAGDPTLEFQALHEAGGGGRHHQVNVRRLVAKPVHGGPIRSHLHAGHGRQGLPHDRDDAGHIGWIDHLWQGRTSLLERSRALCLLSGEGSYGAPARRRRARMDIQSMCPRGAWAAGLTPPAPRSLLLAPAHPCLLLLPRAPFCLRIPICLLLEWSHERVQDAIVLTNVDVPAGLPE